MVRRPWLIDRPGVARALAPGRPKPRSVRYAPMRLAVYTDYTYSRDEGGVYAERAFALFLSALSERIERTVVFGRMRPSGGSSRYRLPDGVDFVALPYYESLAHPPSAGLAMARSVRAFWRGLDDVDVCWLLGPHPLALVFAGLAALRRRRLVLGVRQDLVAYTRSRYPGRRLPVAVAAVLDAAYRAIGRFCPVIAVGPALARRYGRSRRVLEIAVSLVSDDEVAAAAGLSRDYRGELRILSVGRLDAEKNPTMLAEVLAGLQGAGGRDWRLVVCGEGPLEGALRQRLEQLGVADRAELRGYVQHGAAMRETYADAHMLLHVSWTEGLPQVIIEALAARLPVVATDVGGIGDAVGPAAVLIAPGDVGAAISALQDLAQDPAKRAAVTEAAGVYARNHTLEREVERVAEFVQPPARGGG
jgi:glycosyltransferase involved in cell wall biosynthesis